MIGKILQNKVIKNFSYLTGGSIISQFLLLFTVIKITNKLSPDIYGIYSFILAQGILLFTIGDLGIKAIIIRTVARNKERTNDILVNGLRIRGLAIIVLVLIYIIYNYFLGNLEPLHLVFLGVYAFIFSIYNLFEYVFLGNQKMLFPSIIKVIQSFVWFVLIFTMPDSYFEIDFLISSFLILNFIQTAIVYYFLKKQNLFIGRVENFKESSISLLKESWPYFSIMVLTIPTDHLPNNFLDINSLPDEVGYFNLAKKLMTPISLIVTFSITAIFPNLAAEYVNNYSNFKKLVTNGLGFYIVILAIFSFIFALFSKEAVLILFNDNYIPAIKIIQLQVWYVFISGVNHLIVVIYSSVNQDKNIFKLALLGALFKTPIIYFGSFYGAFGISVAFVISTSIYQFYFWKKFNSDIKIPMRKEKWIWFLVLLLFVISYFVDDLNFILKILFTILVLSFIFFLSKDEISLILKRKTIAK